MNNREESAVEKVIKEILSSPYTELNKSNVNVPQCWNEHSCEIKYDMQNYIETGGYLTLKISIIESESFENSTTLPLEAKTEAEKQNPQKVIIGTVEEIWFWDSTWNPSPVINFELKGKPVSLVLYGEGRTISQETWDNSDVMLVTHY